MAQEKGAEMDTQVGSGIVACDRVVGGASHSIHVVGEIIDTRKSRAAAEGYARSWDADRAEVGLLPLAIRDDFQGYAIVETGCSCDR